MVGWIQQPGVLHGNGSGRGGSTTTATATAAAVRVSSSDDPALTSSSYLLPMPGESPQHGIIDELDDDYPVRTRTGHPYTTSTTTTPSKAVHRISGASGYHTASSSLSAFAPATAGRPLSLSSLNEDGGEEDDMTAAVLAASRRRSSTEQLAEHALLEYQHAALADVGVLESSSTPSASSALDTGRAQLGPQPQPGNASSTTTRQTPNMGAAAGIRTSTSMEQQQYSQHAGGPSYHRSSTANLGLEHGGPGSHASDTHHNSTASTTTSNTGIISPVPQRRLPLPTLPNDDSASSISASASASSSAPFTANTDRSAPAMKSRGLDHAQTPSSSSSSSLQQQLQSQYRDRHQSNPPQIAASSSSSASTSVMPSQHRPQQQQQQQIPPNPTARRKGAETASHASPPPPRVNSFFGALDDHGAGLEYSGAQQQQPQINNGGSSAAGAQSAVARPSGAASAGSKPSSASAARHAHPRDGGTSSQHASSSSSSQRDLPSLPPQPFPSSSSSALIPASSSSSRQYLPEPGAPQPRQAGRQGSQAAASAGPSTHRSSFYGLEGHQQPQQHQHQHQHQQQHQPGSSGSSSNSSMTSYATPPQQHGHPSHAQPGYGHGQGHGQGRSHPRSQSTDSRGHSPNGGTLSSRAPSQSLARIETGFSASASTSTLQHQQQYAADAQHRRRVSSWGTRSNPSSVYGLNALSPNLGGGDAASINGSNASGQQQQQQQHPPVPTLSQAHLRPGDRASLLSHQKTLELYRLNVKKTNDPDVTYEFATFMFGIAKEMGVAIAALQAQAGNSGSGLDSHQVSEENLLASLHDHSGSPSPDPSMSFHSRSSGSSGELPSNPSSSHGGGLGFAAALGGAITGGSKKARQSLSPNPNLNPGGSLHPSNQLGHAPHASNVSISALAAGTGGASSPTARSMAAERKALINEAIALLKRNADRGHHESQFFLADCYAQGIVGSGRRGSMPALSTNLGGNTHHATNGTSAPSGIAGVLGAPFISSSSSSSSSALPHPPPGDTRAAIDGSSSGGSPTNTASKSDYDKALMLYTAAAKHGHVPSCFRAAQCFENGWGCRKDAGKAVQFYKKAASQSYAPAMYRLGMAELNGELGLTHRQKEGFKWLKRVAELAESNEAAESILTSNAAGSGASGADEPTQPLDPSNPLSEPSARACAVQALHELALLHERGIANVVFVDNEYAAELLARASELGYAPSAYKLGECYEYGRMGCPQDSALSIHYYNIAAQQNHKEACFALTAWYLVGSPGVLPQSDTEAFLWAKKAAEQGLAKAEYAVGYFTEVGIGTIREEREAIAWFRRAAEHGDKRAVTRLRNLGGVEQYPSPPTSPTKGKGSVLEPLGGGSRLAAGLLHGKKGGRADRRLTSDGAGHGHTGGGKKTEDCLIM